MFYGGIFLKNQTIFLKDEYSTLGDEGSNARLDLYLPYNLSEMNRQNNKRPCIIVVPGGGYGGCSEREAEPIALNFLNEGYNAFVLYYSCKPKRFPIQLLEVAAVFDLINSHSDEWNCDISKIGLIGFSAGGHLVAHYSNAYNCSEVRDVFKNSCRPDFSVLCYPVITADNSDNEAHLGSFENLLGHLPNNAEVERFSCEKLVSKDTPPTFIWHTASDNCVPVENSLKYSYALSKNNVPYELHIYPYGEHGLATCDAQTYDVVNEEIRYASCWIESLKKWLKYFGFSIK